MVCRLVVDRLLLLAFRHLQGFDPAEGRTTSGSGLHRGLKMDKMLLG